MTTLGWSGRRSSATAPVKVRVERFVSPGTRERELLARFGLGPAAQPSSARELHHLAYAADDTPLGAATLRPVSDADVLITVDQPHRRRGIGTVLLRACAHGATDYARLFATATDGTPGAAFLDRHGFRTESAMHQLRLTVPRRRPRLPRLPGYRLREWAGAPPADLGPALWAAKRRTGDMPSVGMAASLRDPTTAVRRMPERVQRLGNVLHTVAAVDVGEGAIVGYTELVVVAGSHRAEQGNTVVLPAHRGRGLGRWLKLAMLDRLLRLHPETTEIETENAAENAPMLAINAALGFELVCCTRRRWAYVHSLLP